MQNMKFDRFKALHERSGAFVMPNAWDAGSARILTAIGYEAIGTTSAGYAFSIGQRDSSGSFTREQILDNANAILQATNLPVSADLEEGFGETPKACAETIRAASNIGLVGGSIEDATGNADKPIFDFNHAVERVAAACEAASGLPILITARAENFLYGRQDLADTVSRLQAFSSVGAHVLYAPGLNTLDQIQTVCTEVDKPVNVVMGLSGTMFTFDELQKSGVKRISVGGSFARAALGEFIRAAKEVKENGTFTYAERAIPDSEAAAFMHSDENTAN